jgi:hypothetical protein
MTNYQQQLPNDDLIGLEGSVQSMTDVDNNMEISIRLSNPLDRTIHYISDVRAMIFDPLTKRLRVRLSDQGLEMLLVGISMEPKFRMIDPQSESLIKVRLPKTIVKLSDVPSPTGEVRFEEHEIANAEAIEIEIGWADTPYYSDPRDRSQDISSFASWEQQRLQLIFTPRSELDRELQ